jgi:hypothetical protein
MPCHGACPQIFFNPLATDPLALEHLHVLHPVESHKLTVHTNPIAEAADAAHRRQCKDSAGSPATSCRALSFSELSNLSQGTPGGFSKLYYILRRSGF